MKKFLFTVAVSCMQANGLAAQQVTPDPSPSVPAEVRRIPDTLMFTIDELNEIQSRLASGDDDVEGEARGIEDASLYLSTIIYSGPSDWTIWVNNVPIAAGQEFRSFQISAIGPDFVELLVPLSAQGMRPVRLAPNQSFVTRSGAVIEGKWPQ